MRGGWLAALTADPCRIARALLDWRSLWRLARQLRVHGLNVVRSELASGATPINAEPPTSRIPPRSPNVVDLTLVPFTLRPAQGERNRHNPWKLKPFVLSLSKHEWLKSTALPRSPDTASKTILVIDRSIPQFDRDAGSRSSDQYLQLFRDLGLRVYFLPNDQIIREPYAGRLRDFGIEILAGKGIRCGGWKKWLATHRESIDLVFLHRPTVARYYLKYIRQHCRAKIFYCGHDLRYWREARRYAIEKDAFHRAESRYWEGIEIALVQQADVSYFFSGAEVAEIRQRLPSAEVRAIPLFLEQASNRPNARPFASRKDLLFVGNFAHSPNVDAVSWFAADILPRIKRNLPEIRLRVVGANPPAAVLSLAGDDVQVTGAVSDQDLRKHYGNARLVVVPLRYGAGVKGKVVEALQQGVPVVATSVGAEGIPKDALTLADSAEEFAAAVSGLSCDEARWETAHRKANEAFARHFSRDRAIEILKTDFEL